MAGRKPDYRVGAMNKGTEERTTIGAAWWNADKTISIKLNSFVVLTAGPDLVITMFPEGNRPFPKKETADREIPF